MENERHVLEIATRSMRRLNLHSAHSNGQDISSSQDDWLLFKSNIPLVFQATELSSKMPLPAGESKRNAKYTQFAGAHFNPSRQRQGDLCKFQDKQTAYLVRPI